MEAHRVAGFLVEWYFSPLRGVRVPLLLGPMGVGKSTAVREAAMEIAARLGLRYREYDGDSGFGEGDFVLVDFRLAGVASEDLVGLPREDGGSFVYRPMRWVRVLQERPGMLLLDEITNVSRDDVKSRIYEIALQHRVGLHRLSEDVMVVMAGNTDEHSSLALPLPDPLKSRTLLVRVEPSPVEEWIAWMDRSYGDSWERQVGVFLAGPGRKFFATTRSEGQGFRQLPDPRGWTHLSLYLASGGLLDREILAGFVGDDAAQAFMTFVNGGLTLDQLIREPGRWRDLEQPAKEMLVSELIRRSRVVRKKYLPLLSEIAASDRELFIVWLMRLDKKIVWRWLEVLEREKGIEQVLKEVSRFVAIR